MKLYRFYGLGDKEKLNRFTENICNRRLPCNHPINFNDPFEGCCFCCGLTNEESENLNKKKEKMIAQIPEPKRALFNISNLVLTNRSIVSCFEPEGVFKNKKHYCDLMWAHYADSHNGVCVEYEFDDEDISRSFEKDQDGGIKVFNATNNCYHFSAQPLKSQKVTYRNEPHIVHFCGGKTSDQDDEFLYTKSEAWSYEEEFRLVATLPPEYGFELSNYYSLVYNKKCLSAIYFGFNIDSNDEMNIRNKLKEKKISCTFYKSFIDDKSFYIQYKPI